MDNQHKMIKGYRDLSAEEIALMNEIKAMAVQVGELVAKVESHVHVQWDSASDNMDEEECTRLFDADSIGWQMRAKNDLQDGFMKLTRAVAQPTTF